MHRYGLLVMHLYLGHQFDLNINYIIQKKLLESITTIVSIGIFLYYIYHVKLIKLMI
jgi:hypothetical protein